jgi:hypothetical protein
MELISKIFDGHPYLITAFTILTIQYYLSKEYPKTMVPITMAFQVICLLYMIYCSGYNMALIQIPYEANDVNILRDGVQMKLGQLLKSWEKDTTFPGLLLLASVFGWYFFPWLEKHRRDASE